MSLHQYNCYSEKEKKLWMEKIVLNFNQANNSECCLALIRIMFLFSINSSFHLRLAHISCWYFVRSIAINLTTTVVSFAMQKYINSNGRIERSESNSNWNLFLILFYDISSVLIHRLVMVTCIRVRVTQTISLWGEWNIHKHTHYTHVH